MTPREYSREVEAYEQRQLAERRRDLALSWTTGAFASMAVFGKLPDLKTVLDRVEHDGHQTYDQMKQQIAMLSKLTGFPMREADTRG